MENRDIKKTVFDIPENHELSIELIEKEEVIVLTVKEKKKFSLSYFIRLDLEKIKNIGSFFAKTKKISSAYSTLIKMKKVISFSPSPPSLKIECFDVQKETKSLKLEEKESQGQERLLNEIREIQEIDHKSIQDIAEKLNQIYDLLKNGYIINDKKEPEKNLSFEFIEYSKEIEISKEDLIQKGFPLEMTIKNNSKEKIEKEKENLYFQIFLDGKKIGSISDNNAVEDLIEIEPGKSKKMTKNLVIDEIPKPEKYKFEIELFSESEGNEKIISTNKLEIGINIKE